MTRTRKKKRKRPLTLARQRLEGMMLLFIHIIIPLIVSQKQEERIWHTEAVI